MSEVAGAVLSGLRTVPAVLLVGVVAAALLGSPAPALAHGGDAPDATNYRTEVTAAPALAGLTVRAVEAGARLELINRTGRTIEVLGYENEPYLEVRPDGVYENVHSPATYINVSLDGGAPVPLTADPTAPPQWRRASAGSVVRWHDHRTHWMSSAQPPAVAAAPDRPHRIRDWVVPLRDSVSTVEVRGTLDWVPPPFPLLWWGLALAVALAVAALGLAWDRAVPALAGAASVGGVIALGYVVAREVDAGATGVGGVLIGVLRTQQWPAVSGLAILAAAGYALLRRSVSDLALGLAGACLALVAGTANAAIFVRAVAPVPGNPIWARLACALVIGIGAGLAFAVALRLRSLARAPVTPQDAVP